MNLLRSSSVFLKFLKLCLLRSYSKSHSCKNPQNCKYRFIFSHSCKNSKLTTIKSKNIQKIAWIAWSWLVKIHLSINYITLCLDELDYLFQILKLHIWSVPILNEFVDVFQEQKNEYEEILKIIVRLKANNLVHKSKILQISEFDTRNSESTIDILSFV